MKNLIMTCLLCVFFLNLSFCVGETFCFFPEQIEFTYKGKIFNYNIEKNFIKTSQFNLNHNLNKYNRFGNKSERIQLLNKMISLGFEKKVALDYLFPNLIKQIDSIEKSIYIEPKNAKLNINPNRERVFQISDEIIGIKINKTQLINAICSNYQTNNEMKFEIPIIKTEPSILKCDLEKATNLRSDFSTNISNSSPDRKHNIKNALTSINKVEISPNEVFSFNQIVGKRSLENGYREAKIIINNEFVNGIGGGVCQVSSTLYNSALLAGLEIIEANKHSKQVNYVNYGFDAMVNFGSSDLKFRNNTNEKIIIISNYSSNTARIRIFGEKTNNTFYKLSNEILNITEPIEEIYIDNQQKYIDKVRFEDEYFYLKKANQGMEIKSYREKYINNILISKELLRHDKFKVQNSVKIYGIEKRINQNNEKSTV